MTRKRSFEESLVRTNVSLDTVVEVLDVNALFTGLGSPTQLSETEVAHKLAELGVVVDGPDGGFHITNLGVALFAKNLKEFSAFSAKPVRFIRYMVIDKSDIMVDWEGSNTIADWEDSRGYAVCFHGLLKGITAELPILETFEEGIRQTSSKYCMPALREVLVNALIHQDFTIGGAGPLVEVYRGRVEFSNPGESLVGTDRMFIDHKSRIPRMANAMYQLGLCEKRGTGLDVAMQEIEKMHLPSPEFHSSNRSMKVVLYGPRAFAETTKYDRMRACVHHSTIRWRKQKPMSNASLRQRFGLPESKHTIVSSVIRDCLDAQMIAPADLKQGKHNAKYIPIWATKQYADTQG